MENQIQWETSLEAAFIECRDTLAAAIEHISEEEKDWFLDRLSRATKVSDRIMNSQLTPSMRIREIIGLEETLDEGTYFSYSWNRGYERLESKKDRAGSIEYSGAYHPNVHCEGDGLCRHCGRTLFRD